MIRRYGKAPFHVLFLHGGPGAAGSVAGACQELGQYIGVLEPWQSKKSISALIEELEEQIRDFAQTPLTLIGHSWGAWLSLLYAAQHPQQIQSLIWIGCPPLEESYAGIINQRRLANLSEKERSAFRLALDTLQDPSAPGHSQALHTLDLLAQKADNVCPLEEELEIPPADEQIFTSVWPQAAALRAQGTLLKAVQMLCFPITLIHGEQDPHPPQGVSAPLTRLQVPFTEIILPRCGHTPWIEKYARADFFRLLRAVLNK